IPIPKLMMLYNVVKSSPVSGKKEFQQFARTQTVHLNIFNKCIECGQCEKKCPENLNIIERLKELRNMLSDYGGG
ncbi:4Fe-4S dicluster domain-containing protein, partial [Candidatus Falkowbacteria bacterium]|nr:4Fe-4S dicluster domain-containing protein [Candidatus Falkowbacteria bacterium]